jgi:hypothetical protein
MVDPAQDSGAEPVDMRETGHGPRRLFFAVSEQNRGNRRQLNTEKKKLLKKIQ